MTNKRILIRNKENVKIVKKLLTDKDFNDKFQVPMEIVSEILSDSLMFHLHFDDNRLARHEELFVFNNKISLDDANFVIFEN